MNRLQRLEEKVEKIIDEGEGERRRVIIQPATSQRANDRLLRIAADVYQRRNLALTARDLLPTSRSELEKLNKASGKKLTANTRNTLDSAQASLAVQLGMALLPIARELLKANGLEAISSLLNEDLVKKAVSEVASRGSKRQNSPESQSEPLQLWASRCLVLSIKKADLAKLPRTVLQIQDIYPNRILKLPTLVEAKNLPRAIQEEKVSSWGVNKIGALSVWGAYGARGKGTKVAVLDTGVDASHPDLEGKVTNWAEFDSDGREVLSSQPHDSDQHGTHCSGIIAGGNASGSWIGVAPEAELAVALVLNGRTGTDAQILAGMQWAIEKNVDVISMSLGGLSLDIEPPDPYSQTLVSALAAGIPVISAIGNEGNQITGTPGNDWFAFSVGATDYRDRPAGFSGGRTHIIRESNFLNSEILPLVYSKPEVSAPGVGIRSSIPGKKWAIFNGTSMATPHVAGSIALLLSATHIRDVVTEAQRALLIEDLLTGSVEELGESGQDHRYGFGRINVLRAIDFALDRGY